MKAYNRLRPLPAAEEVPLGKEAVEAAWDLAPPPLPYLLQQKDNLSEGDPLSHKYSSFSPQTSTSLDDSFRKPHTADEYSAAGLHCPKTVYLELWTHEESKNYEFVCLSVV